MSAKRPQSELIRLCKELDIELDGVRMPAMAAAIVNGIRRVLDEIEDAEEDAVDLEQQFASAQAENVRLRDVVARIRQWDYLDTAGDGPYWKKELEAALDATEGGGDG